MTRLKPAHTRNLQDMGPLEQGGLHGNVLQAPCSIRILSACVLQAMPRTITGTQSAEQRREQLPRKPEPIRTGSMRAAYTGRRRE